MNQTSEFARWALKRRIMSTRAHDILSSENLRFVCRALAQERTARAHELLFGFARAGDKSTKLG